jgi:hypothetical protein
MLFLMRFAFLRNGGFGLPLVETPLGNQCANGRAAEQDSTATCSTQPDRELNARSTASERPTSSLRFRTLTSFRSQALASRRSASCLNTSSFAKRLSATPATDARDRNAEISSMNCYLPSCKKQACCSCCNSFCCIRFLLSRSAHPTREVNVIANSTLSSWSFKLDANSIKGLPTSIARQ